MHVLGLAWPDLRNCTNAQRCSQLVLNTVLKSSGQDGGSNFRREQFED